MNQWIRSVLVGNPRQTREGIPQDEFDEVFYRQAATIPIPLAIFLLLINFFRTLETVPHLRGFADAPTISLMAIWWVGFVALFWRLCRFDVPYRQTDLYLFLLFALTAVLLAISIRCKPFESIEHPLVHAQFAVIVFSPVVIHFRYAAGVFVVFLLAVFLSAPPEAIGMNPWVAAVEIAFGLTLIFIMIRVKIYVTKHIVASRWQEREKSAQLVQTIDRLRLEVEERKRAEEKTRTSEAQLRALSQEIINIQERERSRFSRELHDELGQTLTAVKLSLDGIRRRATGEIAVAIEETSQLLADSIRQVRGMATELRPYLLDQLGLEAAIQWSVDRYRGKTNIDWQFESTNGFPRFPLPIEAACFRIAQEAMTNAVRHGHARRITVGCRTDADTVRVTVLDDGIGFGESREPAFHHGLGLLGMKERAAALGGQLRIESEAGKGTLIEVTFRRNAMNIDGDID
jgi:signal transduction histidine kinase